MKVDELLEASVLTPKFTCAVIKPNPGRLGIVETPKGDFLFAQGDEHYMKKLVDTDMREYFSVTNCAYSEVLETNDIKILLEFLRFAENVKQKDGKRLIEKKSLFDFVYEYGFPTTQIIETGEKESLLVSSIQRFLDRLDNLYICYAFWKAIQINDYDLINQISPRQLSINEMQLQLEHRLIPQINLTVLYYDNKPVLTYQTKDLLSLVEAQLAVLASKGDDYLEGGYIEYCADCGQPFIKKRSNSTLCKECKGNTGKSRRYRTKLKAQEKEV